MCRPRTEPTYTAATYETTAAHGLRADLARRTPRVCGERRSVHTDCSCGTRIRRRNTPHSFPTIGRCRGRACWTSFRSGRREHSLRRYPSTQPPAARSRTVLAVPWTSCTGQSTSCWCFYATVGQTSTYSGCSLSADWAVRCRASSCRWSRWNRRCTHPTNGRRSWTRRRSAGSAKGRSWLQNNERIITVVAIIS